jgi:hypothetical protein
VLVDDEAAGVVGRALLADPPMREVEDRIPADIPEEGEPADEELELVETTEPPAEPALPVVADDVPPLPPEAPPELRPPRSLVVKLDPSLRPC